MSKIEIITRDVQGTGFLPDQGSPQHTFLVYTDDERNREVLGN